VDGNEDRAAKAFEQTAKAFQQAAEAFEQTAGAFEPKKPRAERSSSPRPPAPQPTEDQDRRLREFIQAAIIGVTLGLIIHFWLSGMDTDDDVYSGVGDGLVFAHCDEPVLGLFHPSVELWQVDPVVGTLDLHHGVELPAQSRLAYPCDTVAGLARRLFDDDFQHTVVQISTPSTGAERVHIVDLGTGDDEPIVDDADATHAPLPHDGLAVFGPDGRTVWYRSANDGTVHTASIDETGERDEPVARLDVDALAFTVLDAVRERILAQGDPSADTYFADLALPNPTGDMAVSARTLYTVDEGESVRLTCDVFEDATDLCGTGQSLATLTVRPAAWLDDRTLIAIAGAAGQGNTLVRIEIDDYDRLWACPAVPPSDWTYTDVVGDPAGEAFVTVAERNGERMLFRKATDAAGDQHPVDIAPPPVPGDARLIAWTSDVAGGAMVPHICATGG
jgi:hypothetical protein